MASDYPISQPRRRNPFSAFLDNIVLLLGLVFFAWSLELVDLFLGNSLDNFGIRPRDTDRLAGLLTAHWLHGGWPHIASNTVPFMILGGFVLIGGRKMFWKVSTFVALVGGGLLWLFGGAGENHIGASLVIFGYLGFLLARGFFERSKLWVIISIVTLALYGTMIFGVLPGQDGVSWLGHLFGLLAGVAAARFLVPKNVPIYEVGSSVGPPPIPLDRRLR